MKCKHCGYVMNEKMSFCPNCGNALQMEKIKIAYCVSCGGELQPGENYCHVCGTKRRESNVPVSINEESVEGEHTVTISDSTTDNSVTSAEDSGVSGQEEVVQIVENVDTSSSDTKNSPEVMERSEDISIGDTIEVSEQETTIPLVENVDSDLTDAKNNPEVVERDRYIPIGKPTLDIGQQRPYDDGQYQVKIDAKQPAIPKEAGKNYFKSPILWIVSISLLVICLLLNQYMTGLYKTYNDDTTDEDIPEEIIDVDLSDFAITGTNSLSANQMNIYYEGLTYLYKEVLYVCGDGEVIAYDADFKTEEVILEENASNIYVDDTYLYYCDSNNDYKRMDLKSEEIETMLENIYYPQHINNHLYYQKDSDKESVYVYDIETKEDKKINDENSYNIFVEEQENRIFYTNGEYQLCKMDLDGQNKEVVITGEFISFMVEGNTLFYTSETGVNSYNLETKESTLLQNGTAMYLNSIEDRIVYSDINDEIYVMDKTGENKTKLMSSTKGAISALFVTGDKIILEEYNTTKSKYYYEIVDMKGKSVVFYEYLYYEYSNDYDDEYYEDYDNGPGPGEGFDF